MRLMDVFDISVEFKLCGVFLAETRTESTIAV
jgi:hypothetical protein